MSYLNSITLVGFVGSDPEQRQAKGNGSKFTVLSVATQRSWKNADGWSRPRAARSTEERLTIHRSFLPNAPGKMQKTNGFPRSNAAASRFYVRVWHNTLSTT